MKLLLVLLTSVFISPSWLYAGGEDTLIKGVNASFKYTKNIFPVEWQNSTINATGEGLDSKEIIRCKKITTTALAKYPTAVLTQNLATVYWLKKMSFFNVGYGGTNSTRALYLTNDGVTNGYTNKYLEQTFHHEFSSILFRNYPSLFDTISWKKLSSPDFLYTDPEDGVGAIRKNASSQDIDSSLCERGILTQYALSSMENDINTFAQNIFCPSKNFWSTAEHYPLVRKKVLLLISFYQKINPVFTEEYFRNLDK